MRNRLAVIVWVGLACMAFAAMEIWANGPSLLSSAVLGAGGLMVGGVFGYLWGHG